MARPLRISFDGALYHVMSRGNARQPIVRDDKDRRRRADWLAGTVEACRWRLHAYCLMNNHEHLFVETPEGNLSASMQRLNGSYTSYFNRRHRRVGHLFQGRFKAVIIESEGHYLEISRYIHLNPVRARLAERPEDWAWSSYSGYVRQSQAQPWVTYRRVLREFGRNAAQARRAYRRYVLAGMDEHPFEPWANAVQGMILGSESFVEEIRNRLGGRARDASLPQLEPLRPRPSLERIVATAANAFEADRSRWRSGCRCDDVGRAVACWLARRAFGYPARDVADMLGYASHSSVDSAIRRIEAAPRPLKRKTEAIGQRITNV
ncbi:MAG: transposase [Planctomycetes bacterium]|nr:transposase [Planctomycetota bacterium]